MKTLRNLLTAVCLASLASCTVYETAPTNPPPPQPVVYEQPAPAPAPAPAPVYQQPAPAPAPAPVYNNPPAQQYNEQQQYNEPVTTQTFYDQLSPYGQWVNYGSYGYVWIPSAGSDFVPYSTAGHWIYTDNGWMWASDYRWGWATFHYGRWEYDAYYGWFWIPDTQWAPAWVSWRQCDGYYGWAPLGWGYGWNNYNEYNPPSERWVFVNERYINSPNVYNYYEPRDRYNGYIGRSRVITNSYYDNTSHVTYAAGPGQNDVARATGQPVTPVRIAPATGPGAHTYGNGTVSVYRPTFASQPTNSNAPRPAPRNVTNIKEVTPPAQRPVVTKPEPVVQHIEPAPVQHTQPQPFQQQPAPVQHVEPAPQQHVEPAPVQHTEPAPVQHVQPMQPVQQQPAPVQHVEPAPVQHTEPVQQQPAPVQHVQPAQQQQQNQNHNNGQQQQNNKQTKQNNNNKTQKVTPITPKKEEK